MYKIIYEQNTSYCYTKKIKDDFFKFLDNKKHIIINFIKNSHTKINFAIKID